MNKPILLSTLLALSLSFANAQQPYQMTPKEAEKHAKEVAKSRESGDIIWDYDTVFVAGVPNCIVYKVDKGAFAHDDYSIRSLTGQELIYVRYCTAIDYSQPHAPNTPPPTIGYYSYIFYDTKNTGETYSTTRPFKTAGRYHLVANGTSIDPNGEANFIAENPVKWSIMQPPQPPPVIVVQQPAPAPPPVVVVAPQQPVNTYSAPAPPPQPNTYSAPAPPPQPAPAPNTYSGNAPQPAPNTYSGNAPQPAPNTYSGNAPQYVIVERPHDRDVRVDGNNVYQGDMQIGTIRYNEINANGMLMKTMEVFLNNGVKVATAYTQGDPNMWTVVTMRDHAMNTVNPHDEHHKEEIIRYLVRGNYL